MQTFSTELPELQCSKSTKAEKKKRRRERRRDGVKENNQNPKATGVNHAEIKKRDKRKKNPQNSGTLGMP